PLAGATVKSSLVPTSKPFVLTCHFVLSIEALEKSSLNATPTFGATTTLNELAVPRLMSLVNENTAPPDGPTELTANGSTFVPPAGKVKLRAPLTAPTGRAMVGVSLVTVTCRAVEAFAPFGIRTTTLERVCPEESRSDSGAKASSPMVASCRLSNVVSAISLLARAKLPVANTTGLNGMA